MDAAQSGQFDVLRALRNRRKMVRKRRIKDFSAFQKLD